MPAKRKPAASKPRTTKPTKSPKMPTAGPKTVQRFDQLAEAFVARGATRSQMFGMPVLKAGERFSPGCSATR